MIIGIVFIIGLFTIIFVLDALRNHPIVRNKKIKISELKYKELTTDNETRINTLLKEIESLKKQNEELKTMYYSICNDKRIMDVFKVLDENNCPEITKQKLSKLWEVLPYYPPDWSIRKWVVKQRDEHKCRDCGKDLYYQKDGIGEVHHILPLSIGGTNEIKNLEFLCHDCHKKKHENMFNYAFSRCEKFTLYEGWTYYELFKKSWYYDKSAPERLGQILALGTYNEDEPDTDKYYNISNWEDTID